MRKRTLGEVGLEQSFNGQLSNCVKNIFTKNYQNLVIVFPVTVDNVGDVLSRFLFIFAHILLVLFSRVIQKQKLNEVGN